MQPPTEGSMARASFHSQCRQVFDRIAAQGVLSAIWRDQIIEETGLAPEVVARALDRLRAVGLVKRCPPRRNDEWCLTGAGIEAQWLFTDEDDLPENP